MRRGDLGSLQLTRGAGGNAATYKYELDGNMNKQVTGGRAFTYDNNGNTLTGDASTGTNTWSNYDQLATVTVGGARSYSYADRVQSGGVTFTTGVTGQLSSDTGGAAARSYIRDPDGTLIALQTGGTSYYYTLDNIGSVIQLTNNTTGGVAATYTYNPYGKTTATTGGTIATTNPYRYASGYTDGTSLIKFGARYYNPTLARFTQTDPSGNEQLRLHRGQPDLPHRSIRTGLAGVGRGRSWSGSCRDGYRCCSRGCRWSSFSRRFGSGWHSRRRYRRGLRSRGR